MAEDSFGGWLALTGPFRLASRDAQSDWCMSAGGRETAPFGTRDAAGPGVLPAQLSFHVKPGASPESTVQLQRWRRPAVRLAQDDAAFSGKPPLADALTVPPGGQRQ